MPTRVASLNIVSPDAEALYFGAVARWAVRHRANSLDDLRAVLDQQLNDPTSPSTLDLMGHSTRDHHLFRLGDDRIDILDTRVDRSFRSIAEDRLLSQLEVCA